MGELAAGQRRRQSPVHPVRRFAGRIGGGRAFDGRVLVGSDSSRFRQPDVAATAAICVATSSRRPSPFSFRCRSSAMASPSRKLAMVPCRAPDRATASWAARKSAKDRLRTRKEDVPLPVRVRIRRPCPHRPAQVPQDFAKRLILQYFAVFRWNEREAHHVTVGIREAGESQRDEGEMRGASWRPSAAWPLTTSGISFKSYPLIPAEQRIPQCLGDEGAGANVRHVARDMFEDQPASPKICLFGVSVASGATCAG